MNRQTPVRLAKSVLSPAEAEAVRRVLIEDGYLGMGRKFSSLKRNWRHSWECRRIG